MTSLAMGCDTHLDWFTAAVVNPYGQPVDQRRCHNGPAGYAEAVRMCRKHDITVVGIEGASSHGRPLAAYLTAQGIEVHDVPARVTAAGRDTGGKTDPGDAIAVAKAVASARGYRWIDDPDREALRVVVHRRETLVRAQTADINAMRALLTEIDPQRSASMGRLRSKRALQSLARVRYHGDTHRDTVAGMIRDIARECLRRREQINQLAKTIARLLPPEALRLIAEIEGCGVITAGILFAELAGTAGFATAAKFAKWAGAAPIPVASGRTDRYRLNRGGNRQANRALHIIIVTQHRRGGEAADYIRRRQSDGKTQKEAIRAAKRHLARRIWKLIYTPQPQTAPTGGEAAAA